MERFLKRQASYAVVASLFLLLAAWSSASVTAQVLLPTFSVDIEPDMLSIPQGASDHYVITVESISNFNDPVQLSLTNAPAGIILFWGPNPVTPPPNGNAGTTVYLTVPSGYQVGTYQMTLVAMSGSETKNYNVGLQVTSSGPSGDWTISVSPSSLSIQQGSSGFATLNIGSIGGFSSPVALSSSNAPSGVTVVLSTSQVTPPSGGTASAGVTVNVGGSAQVGYFVITLTGQSGLVGSSQPLITHSTQLGLQISSSGPPQDFTISVQPGSMSVTQGGSSSATVVVSSVAGFSSPVSLTASGMPSGLNVNFSPNPITPSPGGSAYSTATVTTASYTGPGTYAITITGSGTGQMQVIITHSTTLVVTVTQAAQPDFSINPAASSMSVSQGSPATQPVSFSSINGFSGTIALSVGWVGSQPAGASASMAGSVTLGSGGTASVSLTVNTSPSTPVGTYTLSVLGSSGSISHSSNVLVQVLAGTADFSITLSPNTLTVAQGSQGTTTVTIHASGTFNSPVNLVASDPSGVSMNFATNPVTPPMGGSASSQLTISASSSAATGTFQIAITGNGGGLTDSAALTLVVTAGPQPPPPAQPDFTIYASLASFVIAQGATAQSTIVMQSENGFSSPVSLSASWVVAVPSGVTYSLAGTVTPQANQDAQTVLVINVSPTASTGTFTLRVHAQGGALAHSADISIQVTPRQCIIATATYGSDLSPEVQYVRNLRDDMILNTRAGSAFMTAFNTWYYSFSPGVAQEIGQNTALRGAMTVALAPAIAILRVGAIPFTLLPTNGELAAVLSGLVISLSLGATYLGLPTAGLLRFNSALRRRARTLERTGALALLTSLIIVGMGEVTGLAPLMIVGTSILVLSGVVVGALVPSRLAIHISTLRRSMN